MRAYGAGLVDAVTGFPAVFTVLTNDEPGTLGTPHCETLGTPHGDTLCATQCYTLVTTHGEILGTPL